jgi:hypothetical protein
LIWKLDYKFIILSVISLGLVSFGPFVVDFFARATGGTHNEGISFLALMALMVGTSLALTGVHQILRQASHEIRHKADDLAEEIEDALSRLESGHISSDAIVTLARTTASRIRSLPVRTGVPIREANLRRWKAVWRYVVRDVENGYSVAEIVLRLQRMHPDVACSEATLRKVIVAGQEGLLE